MQPEEVQQIIDALEGTCKSLYDEVDEDLLTQDNYDQIDEQIFKCETCSWWFPIEELADEEGNCIDCST